MIQDLATCTQRSLNLSQLCFSSCGHIRVTDVPFNQNDAVDDAVESFRIGFFICTFWKLQREGPQIALAYDLVALAAFILFFGNYPP